MRLITLEEHYRSERVNKAIGEAGDYFRTANTAGERFAAFATLPVADPQAAASELEWAVGAGFKGALINGVTQGRFLDDPFFTPLLERAEALGVPIYIHPAPPPEPVRQAYFSGLEPGLARMLSIAGWGWHAEVGLHTVP